MDLDLDLLARTVLTKSPLFVDRLAKVYSEEVESQLYNHEELGRLSDRMARIYKPVLEKNGCNVSNDYWKKQFMIEIDPSSPPPYRIVKLSVPKIWEDFLNAMCIQLN